MDLPVQVSLKHSGSLFMYAGHEGGAYAKNSFGNMYDQARSCLLFMFPYSFSLCLIFSFLFSFFVNHGHAVIQIFFIGKYV